MAVFGDENSTNYPKEFHISNKTSKFAMAFRRSTEIRICKAGGNGPIRFRARFLSAWASEQCPRWGEGRVLFHRADAQPKRKRAGRRAGSHSPALQILVSVERLEAVIIALQILKFYPTLDGW